LRSVQAAVRGTRFEGYTDAGASEQKILRDAFEPGDAWFRTGDLMRMDEDGYVYFVDRIGDTYRWKGENVATSEVEDAIRTFPGVVDAAVYGVGVPGADGRAGMAALAAAAPLDLTALRAHLRRRLPHYARPIFLRVQPCIDVTATFKHTKQDLAHQGYDPDAIGDPVYIEDPAQQTYVRLDGPFYRRIQTGRVLPSRSRNP
jgi:fatty-acyl-CoA synthase